MDKPPNPGSPEAVATGCKCPVMDNGHGKCAWGNPEQFWISVDCPLHGAASEQAPEPRGSEETQTT